MYRYERCEHHGSLGIQRLTKVRVAIFKYDRKTGVKYNTTPYSDRKHNFKHDRYNTTILSVDPVSLSFFSTCLTRPVSCSKLQLAENTK
jgi:hypothetical protein